MASDESLTSQTSEIGSLDLCYDPGESSSASLSIKESVRRCTIAMPWWKRTLNDCLALDNQEWSTLPETIRERLTQQFVHLPRSVMLKIIQDVQLNDLSFPFQTIADEVICRHLPITRSNMAHSDPTLSFIMDGHSPVSLVEFFRELCAGPPTASQRSAIEGFEKDVAQQASQWRLGLLGSFRNTDAGILQRYMRLFDSVLFSGSLDGLLQLKVVYPMISLGHTVIERGYSIIAVKRRWDIISPRARLREYLLVLLHEMLHAFLHTYCCRFDKCRSEPQSLGKTGHGELFCDILYLLSKTLKRLLPQIPTYSLENLDKEVAWTYLDEVDEPETLISSRKLQEWGFNEARTLAMVKDRREFFARNYPDFADRKKLSLEWEL